MNLRRPLLFFILSLYSVLLTAQPLPNTLLWRISGRDGHHLSYLYGTMHLTDDRLFSLGDSLYAAIRHSDGFAMEVDPGAMTSMILDEAVKQGANEKNIREMLSDREFKKYGPLLAKRLGKPMDEITARDIKNEKSKWFRQVIKAGKMPTFLDLYLFDVARRQQKWTGGVEDPGDQRGLFDNVDKTDILGLATEGNEDAGNGLKSMIDIYLRQDLNAIDTFFATRGDIKSEDEILVKRNHKMAMRMDSLSGVRSMVFAVGAAHLPGNDGLINLLRAKGFTVEPVFSSARIKANDYPLPALPDSWQSVSDENGFFRIDMPGKPNDLTFMGILKAKALWDVFANTGYIAMAVHSVYNDNKTDSLFDVLAMRVFNVRNKKEYTPVTVGQAHGRQYTHTDDDGYKKGYILSSQGVLYVVMGTALQENEKNKADIDKSLHSFRLLGKPAAAAKKLTRFTDSVLAYSVLLPAPLNPYPSNDEGWRSRLFLSMDQQDGTYYFIGVNSVLKGNYITNDSSIFEGMKAGIEKKLKKLEKDTSWLSKGQLVREFEGPMKDADMTMHIRNINRGNRWYSLLAMYPLAGPGPGVDSFFSSFEQLPYPSLSWDKRVSGDSIFSAWAPIPFSYSKDDSTGVETYTSFDSTHAISYDIVAFRPGPYFWSSSDSAFWQQRIKDQLSAWRDSLVDKNPVENGDARGWEWIKRERTAHLFYRERLLLHGDKLYAIVVNSAADQLHSADNERFFREFRFSTPTTGNPYLQSKADSLLKDLFSTDSATVEQASTALQDAQFERRDLPLLYNSLLKVSGEDRHKDWKPVNNGIKNAIERLKDSSVFSFAWNAYGTVPDSNAFIRANLLELMAIPDSTHFAMMFGLLAAHPPRQAVSYRFGATLEDTLSLTARFFPQLLPLLKDTVHQARVLRLANLLLDSNYLGIKALGQYKDTLIRYAGKRVRQLRSGDNEYSVGDEPLIDILGRFNDAPSLALLRKFLMAKDHYIKLKAAGALIKEHHPVDPAVLPSLAANNADRLPLFRLLTKLGRMDLFPAVWRTQKALAMSEMYAAAADDEEGENITVEFIREKLVESASAPGRYFFCKLLVDGKAYLACAGAYARDPSKLSTDDIEVRMEDEPYSATQLAGQMSALLEKMSRTHRPGSSLE